MKSHARVVVIGGGIAGVSILYHLTRLGWTDVTLLEESELASGTTWHSAAHCIMPYVSRAMTRFTRETIKTFGDVEAETGRSAGFLKIGSLTLVTDAERIDELKRLASAARVESVPFELVSPAEAAAIWPLASLEGVLVAGYSPTAGRADASSATAALAAAAIQRGAEVNRFTRVTETRLLAQHEWVVETTAGPITAEYIVNAAGQWARDLGRLAGVDVPTVPVEHQYVLTAPIAQLSQFPNLPILRDPDHGFYLRPEGEGLLVGVYEDDVRVWGAEAIPSGFHSKLLPPDIDRIAPWVQNAAKRVPIMGEAGIRTIVNGPDAFTADDRFVMGPVPGTPNYFVFAGFNSAGVQTSPGAARYLAEWIVSGEPTMDLDEYDAQRFGPHTRSLPYLIEGVKETYRDHYPIRYPIQERRTGRPFRTSPIHDILASRGAVFGERFGWERPVWFAEAEHAEDRPSFRRPNWFEAVGRECLAVRDRVGIVDQSSFSKHVVEGPGAAAMLDRLIATALPSVGCIRYALLLSERGGMTTDLTITCIAPDRFYVVGAAASEVRDRERLLERQPRAGGVTVRTVSTEIGVLTLTGPRSRELLERASSKSMSAATFPFLTWQEIPIGRTLSRALRIGYSGELSWELHMPIETLREAYLTLLEAGRDLGVTDVGYRALESLGLEKGYLALGADLTREYSPLEAGLERLIRLQKGPFVGREALISQRTAGPAQRLAWLLLDPSTQALPSGMEPVVRNGEVIGFTVRAGYGYRIGRAVASAYLPPEVIREPGALMVEILGEQYPATLSARAPYDPDNRRREPMADA